MFRRVVAAVVLSSVLVNASAAFAAEPGTESGAGPVAPEVLSTASGSVEISRNGAENPMVEIARSVMWGAVAGAIVGSAIALAVKDGSGESIRWGIVGGTAAGLGTGVYFVSHRPQPGALLELEDGAWSPSASALAAIEPVPGGARARLLAVRF
jgi:hypothetical protein